MRRFRADCTKAGPAAAASLPHSKIFAFILLHCSSGIQNQSLSEKRSKERRAAAELSEKDAVNMLEMARREFNVDDSRIYFMVHSPGGGGALPMGGMYSTIWVAVAGLAPAASGFQWAVRCHEFPEAGS